MLIGPYVLGQFSPIYLQYSEVSSQVGIPLLCCIYSTQLFMMKVTADEFKKAFHSFALMSMGIFVQVLIGILAVRIVMLGSNDAYGLLPFTSFQGGPGVCTAVSNIVGELNNFSVETANSLGNTYATISMLTGVAIGMILVNIARRKGILKKTSNLTDIPKSEFTGYVDSSERRSAADDITNNNSVSTMTLQFSIAGVVIFFGLTVHALITRIPALNSLGTYIVVIAMGFPVGLLFKACKWDRFVDPKSIKHFSSIALEYLIASTIAGTNINVFVTHGALIAVTSLTIIITNIIVAFGLGRLWFKNYWFENSVGAYGVNNGVSATGFLLLRTVDPDDDTGALSPFCTSIAMIAVLTQMFYLMFVPMWITDHGNAVLIGTAGATVVFLILGFIATGRKQV